MKYVELHPKTLVADITPGTEVHKIYLKAEHSLLSCINSIIEIGNTHLTSLVTDVKNIISNNHVEFGIGTVPTLTMTVLGNKDGFLPLLLAPVNWPEMMVEQPGHQMGGVVFVGSQIVDFYNGKFLTDYGSVHDRAASYEAEYIKTIQPENRNSYQISVFDKFKNGLMPKLYNRKQVILVN